MRIENWELSIGQILSASLHFCAVVYCYTVGAVCDRALFVATTGKTGGHRPHLQFQTASKIQTGSLLPGVLDIIPGPEYVHNVRLTSEIKDGTAIVTLSGRLVFQTAVILREEV